MIYQATATPQRIPRILKCPTMLLIQVKVAGTVALSRNQGEAQSSANGTGDGIEFTNANTAGAQQPQNVWWQGELWFNAVGGAGPIPFVLEILSEEGVS